MKYRIVFSVLVVLVLGSLYITFLSHESEPVNSGQAASFDLGK